MKKPTSIIKLLIAFIGIATLLMNAPIALADYYGNNTYFENVPRSRLLTPPPARNIKIIPAGGTGEGLINAYQSGSNSDGTHGFVIPNWYSNNTGPGGTGGAVGIQALRDAYKANTGGDLNVSNQDQRKQALYYLLRDKNTGTGSAAAISNDKAWDKMGSAVVTHTLLGSNFGSSVRNISRTVSSADWAKLESSLVDNKDLEMVRMKSDKSEENTAGVIVKNESGDYVYDAIRYTYDSHPKVWSWVLRSKSNPSKVYYILEIACANPLGDLGGLPPPPPPKEPDEYDLQPSANSNGISSVEPGGQITVDGLVENVGKDPSPGNEWQLIQVVYGPNATPGPNGNKSASDPCNFFTAAGRINPPCSSVAKGTNKVFPPGATTSVVNDFAYNVPDTMEVGTKICFAVSVRPPTQLAEDQGLWRHSNLHCVLVAKSPKLQVWGGDIRSGGKIDTSAKTFASAGLTYGSWSEYGAISGARNDGFASGSGLNNGSPSSDQSSWSSLTFANTGNPLASSCTFGCYNFTLSSPGLVGQFVAQSDTPSINGTKDLNSLGNSGATTVYRAGNITLSGTTISHGKTIILISTGTVTIDGSIKYEDMEYKSTDIKAIPQVIIKAPVINIRNDATQVDAWLLATNGSNTGTLNTCSDVALSVKLTASRCNKALTINGPVIADIVYLRRTAGSESQADKRGDPAETFNLRADAYLWANASGSGSSRIQTVYTRELSPRF